MCLVCFQGYITLKNIFTLCGLFNCLSKSIDYMVMSIKYGRTSPLKIHFSDVTHNVTRQLVISRGWKRDLTSLGSNMHGPIVQEIGSLIIQIEVQLWIQSVPTIWCCPWVPSCTKIFYITLQSYQLKHLFIKIIKILFTHS